MLKMRPTKRAPGGWDSARFLEIVLNFGGLQFSSLFLLSRTPKGHNASRWAA